MSADPIIVDLLASIDHKYAKAVSKVDDILSRLVSQKLAWKLRLPPRQVGVHPSNRGGYAVSAIEVHALGADIVYMGWRPEETAHAVCVEDDACLSIARFSYELSCSDIGLGKVPQEEIKYGSLACSHTNQFLVAVICGVETDDEELAVDGRLSASKLSDDLKLKDALEHGLTWLVISATAASLYPTLCDKVQQARNTPGKAQRQETEVALLVRMQSMATKSSKANDGAVDWTGIKSSFLARKGFVESEIQPLLKFVQIYGGGDSGKFVSELHAFHKVFVPSGRTIPTSTFSALMDLKLEPHELCPFFMSATLKAQATCPPCKAPNKICRYISGSDISSLQTGKKQSMLAAEQILKTCRKLAQDSPVDAALCLGRLDTMVARHVYKKEDKHDSLEAIGIKFVDELNALISKKHGGTSTIVSPWSVKQPDQAAASSQAPNLVQYGEDGVPLAAAQMSLQSAGDELSQMLSQIVMFCVRYASAFVHVHTMSQEDKQVDRKHKHIPMPNRGHQTPDKHRQTQTYAD